MSINHFPQEKLATFHAMNQSAIGIDVHSNLIVGVYQSSTIDGNTWNGDSIYGANKYRRKLMKNSYPLNYQIFISVFTGT